MSKVKLSLLSILVAIGKIENYTNEFGNADEIWEIITTKIKPLKYDIKALLDKEL